MKFQIGELSEEHQKYNRNTGAHRHTHTDRAEDSQLPAETVQKALV